MNNDTNAQVILVDETDRNIGTCDKLSAHRNGHLHRAFSIFLFNAAGHCLLQQRAMNKYHCGGLWSNTCCSHPQPSKSLEQAAEDRLQEEMGIQTEIREVFSFTYRAEFENGLIEHEIDHVFIGRFEGTPAINSDEVAAWKWINTDTLLADMKATPHAFTPWLHTALPAVLSHV